MIGETFEQTAGGLLGLLWLVLLLVVFDQVGVSSELIGCQLQTALVAFLGRGLERFGPVWMIAQERGQMRNILDIREAGRIVAHVRPDQGSDAVRLISGPGSGILAHRL